MAPTIDASKVTSPHQFPENLTKSTIKSCESLLRIDTTPMLISKAKDQSLETSDTAI